MQRTLALTASIAALAVAAVSVLGIRDTAPAAARDETVTLARHGGVARLVDGVGRTLLVRAGDGREAGSAAGAVVPVTTEASVRVGAGVRGRLLGFADRPDGREQVTYAGQPLYRRADRHDGGVPGTGWTPVGRDGDPITRPG